MAGRRRVRAADRPSSIAADTTLTEAFAQQASPIPQASAIAPTLNGDVDAVLARALAKDPQTDRAAAESSSRDFAVPWQPTLRRLSAEQARLPPCAGCGCDRGDSPCSPQQPPQPPPGSRRGTRVAQRLDSAARGHPREEVASPANNAASTTVAAPATTTAPAAPRRSVQSDGASGAALNDAGFGHVQAGHYATAVPLLERAVLALRGSGSLTEAYASYNLAFTRRSLGALRRHPRAARPLRRGPGRAQGDRPATARVGPGMRNVADGERGEERRPSTERRLMGSAITRRTIGDAAGAVLAPSANAEECEPSCRTPPIGGCDPGHSGPSEARSSAGRRRPVAGGRERSDPGATRRDTSVFPFTRTCSRWPPGRASTWRGQRRPKALRRAGHRTRARPSRLRRCPSTRGWDSQDLQECFESSRAPPAGRTPRWTQRHVPDVRRQESWVEDDGLPPDSGHARSRHDRKCAPLPHIEHEVRLPSMIRGVSGGERTAPTRCRRLGTGRGRRRRLLRRERVGAAGGLVGDIVRSSTTRTRGVEPRI